MPDCLFATDLHGRLSRYDKLVAAILRERPAAVFLGGDLLPHSSTAEGDNFVHAQLIPRFSSVRDDLGADYPEVFLILGNDDPRCEEAAILDGERDGLWLYMHGRRASFRDSTIYGYACVPPTPFLLKDWERYDVSRYVDPGCVSPEEGIRTAPVAEGEIKWSTIEKDLAVLAADCPLSRSIFLFHSPPHQTPLDHAALDGKMYDHVPLDVHVGSIAIRRFIEKHRPRITLHGHVHESARLSGEWKVRIGDTICLGAAHDGPELALVRFNSERPEHAARELL